MLNLSRLGIGGIIFLIGAVICVIKLALGKRRKTIPVDGLGLMALGALLVLLLNW